MSGAGVPVEPVRALVQQQGVMDPVAALAAGHLPPAPKAASATATSGGRLESAIRSAANGATFNLADTIAAAGDATIPLDSGSSTAPSWMQRYQQNIANQANRTSAN